MAIPAEEIQPGAVANAPKGTGQRKKRRALDVQITRIGHIDQLPPHREVLSYPNKKIIIPEAYKKNYCVVELMDSTKEVPKVAILMNEQGERQSYSLELRQRVAATTINVASGSDRSYKVNYNVIGNTIKVTDDLLSIVLQKAERIRADQQVDDKTDMELLFIDLLKEAVRMGSSDLHIRNTHNDTNVAFRVNGEMVHSEVTWTGDKGARLCSMVYNTVADAKEVVFDPASRQDANVVKNLEIDGVLNEYRLRYAHGPIFPHGFHAVLRILKMSSKEEGKFDNTANADRTLEMLGYLPEQVHLINRGLMQPEGALVIAGTTGSGKSTTLSKLLGKLVAEYEGRKTIITIENPPEYYIPGTIQCPVVQKEKGEDNVFSNTIKSCMRRDPDVLMIGEIRDKPTAEAFAQAVQSGHTVMSTVHASSALGIFGRMENIGQSGGGFNPLDRFTMTEPRFFSLLMYQRLAGRVCEHCSMDYAYMTSGNRLDKEFEKRLMSVMEYDDVDGSSQNKLRFRGKGCERCNKTAIIGRTVCAEVVEPDNKLLDLLRERDGIGALRYWLNHGYRGRTENGDEVSGGITALKTAIIKMSQGIICPLSVESSFGLIDGEQSLLN